MKTHTPVLSPQDFWMIQQSLQHSLSLPNATMDTIWMVDLLAVGSSMISQTLSLLPLEKVCQNMPASTNRDKGFLFRATYRPRIALKNTSGRELLHGFQPMTILVNLRYYLILLDFTSNYSIYSILLYLYLYLP